MKIHSTSLKLPKFKTPKVFSGYVSASRGPHASDWVPTLPLTAFDLRL